MGRNNLGVVSLIFFAIANILDLVFGWIFYVSINNLCFYLLLFIMDIDWCRERRWIY